jgi:lipoprotein NlpI/transglutaminase-like putative cysteine protease
MRALRWLRPGAGILLAVAVALAAKAEDATAPAKPAATPPVIIKLLHFDIQVDKAGLEVDTVHVQITPTNGAAAQQLMQQPIPYVESTGDVDVLEAYTVKPDGKKLAVATSAIFAQPVPGSPQLPMFNDQRQKVIVFPDVEAGDTLDYTYRYREKQTPLPNAFTFNMKFSRLAAYENVDAVLTAPKELSLVAETHDIEVSKSADDATVTYRWHYSAPTPLAEDTSVLSSLTRDPRILLSSFPSYDAFARAYAAVAEPKAAVTPAIQAKADEITQNVSDHREQARKIYEWVSRHIRYLAVEIGTGAFVPHDADTVLANGYGDCKDHVALFKALLKAKGIASEFVLINSGNLYELPDTAIIGAFDHVIAYLPEFGLYADTTAGVAPFGTLPFAEYGKPVLRISSTGPARAQTPTLPFGQATISVKTTAHIEDDGRITGQSVTTAQGPFSVMLRRIGLAIQGAGPEQAAAAALQQEHLPGSGGFIIPPPESFDPVYSMTATFSIGPVPDLLNGRRTEMPEPLPVSPAPGDFLMGPLFNTKITPDDPTPCFSGHIEEDVSLTAPKGRHFDTAPADATITSPHLAFSSHWSIAGDTITLHREFTSHIDQPLCSGAIRKDTADQLLAIRKSFLYGAALAPDFTPEQSSLLALLKAGRDAAQRGDLDEADRQFSAAIAQGTAPTDAPAVAAAYIGRATIAGMRKQYDDVVSDLASAAKTSPPVGTNAFRPFAQMMGNVREFAAVEKIWGLAIGASPASAELYYNRALVRDDLGRHADAQDDFAKAIALGGTPQALARYYGDRGSSHWQAHELGPALKDYDESIARDQTMAGAYEGRGLVEFASGALDAAHADFVKAAGLDGKNLYYALWLYIADARMGKDAKAALLARTAGSDLATWPGPLVKVARGELAADAIEMPHHPEDWQTARDLCEKDFYLAEIALAGGDKAKAIALFKAAEATNIVEYIEYAAAGYELERLGAR